MRRASKRAATANDRKKGITKRVVGSHDLLTRIRKRRDDIERRVGMLSDSSVLIREDRDR